MTAITLDAINCRLLADVLKKLGGVAEESHARKTLILALQDCPDGARIHIEIEPLEEGADSDVERAPIWSGSPHPDDPDNAWQDDATGEAVCAAALARPHDVNPDTLKCRRCGLYAFEAVTEPCDPGRPN